MSSGYTKLTPTMMIQLAAPHTWVAAVLPVAVGMAIAHNAVNPLDPLLVISLLLACILMQAAVNTLNDYMDFKKGADTEDNQVDATDAVMVYNRVNPQHVFALFIAFMTVALVLGIYIIMRSSWISLAIGLFGALIIVLYSVGRTPLSYLPLGEIASGFTMGGLICLVTTYVLTGEFSWWPLLYSLPLILGIGLINFTNNMCDQEKDKAVNRKTFPVLLGREAARKVYNGTVFAILASACILVAVFHPAGIIMLPVLLLMTYPQLKALNKNPLMLNTRIAAMSQVIAFNVAMGALYAACWLL